MSIISIISNVSPVIGTALGGPFGTLVGTLVSHALDGVDISNAKEVEKKINEDPDCVNRLKELELRIQDLQSARDEANKETGYIRFVRPLLAFGAMLAIFIDIVLIKYIVDDEIIKDILVLMMVFLVWDIRQIYKFYFGNQEAIPGFMLGRFKK